jgi:hypothetical protein
MKIYLDKERTQEVGATIDLGIVPAGEEKQYIFYIYNNEGTVVVDLTFAVLNKDVQIVKSPIMIPDNGTEELVISWKPSLELKQGLKTELVYTANAIWG